MKKDKSKCAETFRKKYPNYSFTLVGYNICPKDLQKEYLKLVNVETGNGFYGIEEKHTCKHCGKVVHEYEYK